MGQSRAATRAVLAAAVRPRGDGVAAALAAARGTVDWPWLLERAAAHRVSALLAARLRTYAPDGSLPHAVQQDMEAIGRRASDRVAQAELTLRQAMRALEAAHVPAVVLKGSVLAETIYGDPELRPFHDVDLLVPPDRLDEAETALGEIGYRFHRPLIRSVGFAPFRDQPSGPPDARVEEFAARRLYREYHCHLVYIAADRDGRLPVEVHWNLMPPGFLRVHPADLWQRTRFVAVAGLEVRTLDLEATLIHVAVHAMVRGHGGFRLLHLADVAWLLSRHAGDLDPDRLWKLADAWRARAYLERALQGIGELLGLPVDRTIAAGCRPRTLGRSLFRYATGDGSAIDGASRDGRLRRLLTEILKESLWDASFQRWPRRAVRRALLPVLARMPGQHG